MDTGLHCEDGESKISFTTPEPGRYLLLTDDPYDSDAFSTCRVVSLAELNV